MEGDVLGRELAPRNLDSHSFFFAPASEPEGSLLCHTSRGSPVKVETAQALWEGRAVGIWVEGKQGYFLFVVV